MPRLDDTNSKTKIVTKFKRTPLRPWDSLEQFSSNEIETQQDNNWDTNRTQTISKSETNDNQSGNNLLIVKDTTGIQLEHNKDTLRTQQDHVTNTNRTQIDHETPIKNTQGTQTEHAKEHIKEHHKNTSKSQKEHHWNTNLGLSYLTGIQKSILIMFYISCKKTRSHITEEFSLINISQQLDIKLGSVKTSLRRLEQKRFISSVTFKKGRGGWTKFELPESVYRELLENDKEHSWVAIRAQQEHHANTYRNTERDTMPPSSSSLNINTTTTNELPEEWKFDLEPFCKIGLTRSHIKSLYADGKISARDVEQSLIEFKYDLDNNTLTKIKTNYANFLMGILRKGIPYVSGNYKTEEESMYVMLVENAKKRNKQKRDMEIITWHESLSDEERKTLLSRLPTHLQYINYGYKADYLDSEEVMEWLWGEFRKVFYVEQNN